MAKKVAQDLLDGFEIDLSNWNMGNYRRYSRAFRIDDYDVVAEELALVVKSWPFAGNPGNPDDLDLLSFPEMGRLAKAIQGALVAAFSQGN